MKPKEAFEILRDTPIDIRSAREDDIHSLYATAQNMALDALQKQMWIPCSERLPEDENPVLIQYYDEEDEAIMFIGCYEYGYFNVWDERIFPDYEEVAWMPLPEPYKEDKE